MKSYDCYFILIGMASMFFFNVNQKLTKGCPMTPLRFLLSQNYAFNSGLIDYSDGILKLMIYGIDKSNNFNQEDLSTFPFYDVFIQPDTGKKKITKSLTDVRNSSYSKDGYFYQVMQYEDWQRALDNSYFGKYEEQLLQCIEKLLDEEDPIILKYSLAL